MHNKKARWKKRTDLFKYVYCCLESEAKSEEVVKNALNYYEFDAEFLSAIEYFAKNKESIIELITSNLSKQWTWERISSVDRSIFVSSVCEAKAIKTDKPIIIDQALVTLKYYGEEESAKYINAVLDKII